jgi:pilus assembly protein CpaB
MARLRGFLWLTAGLVVALLAGFVAYQTLSRAATAPQLEGTAAVPQVQVVVAARAVPIRNLLRAEDLELRDLPVTAAPEGAARTLEDVIGKLNLVEFYPGEPILVQRLLAPNAPAAGGRLSLFMVEDEVLMAIPAFSTMGQIGLLKPGDKVDVLFSMDFPDNRGPDNPGDDDEQATFTLLQNLTIASLVADQPAGATAAAGVTGQNADAQGVVKPKAILLTLNPQDALVLKYMIDAGATLDLVLRAPGVERPFDTDPVDVDYLIDRYDIPIQVGR